MYYVLHNLLFSIKEFCVFSKKHYFFYIILCFRNKDSLFLLLNLIKICWKNLSYCFQCKCHFLAQICVIFLFFATMTQTQSNASNFAKLNSFQCPNKYCDCKFTTQKAIQVHKQHNPHSLTLNNFFICKQQKKL